MIEFWGENGFHPCREIEDFFAAQFRIGKFFQRQPAADERGRNRVRNAELCIDHPFGVMFFLFFVFAPAAHRAHIALADLHSVLPECHSL